ncbi:cupin domain-containing protein [Algirhabdus cladophorae]|uniref:cupin domain-containing protein n=1 Tax=Algirhabdus cladophorae TaxID=3377108 RepID=UPI003B84AA88
MTKANIPEKLSEFDEHWSPRIIASYNDNDVMLAKFSGEFHWHSHPETDDFFLVVAGQVEIDLPDQTIEMGVGDIYVVPAGVEHRPRAVTDEAAVLLIEPKGTPNTGDPATAAPKPTI